MIPHLILFPVQGIFRGQAVYLMLMVLEVGYRSF